MEKILHYHVTFQISSTNTWYKHSFLSKNIVNNNNNGICSGISTRWPFIHCFQIESEFSSVDFCGGRKTGEPGEKPSEQGREPTTNSTHIWRRVREASALTTVPYLLPNCFSAQAEYCFVFCYFTLQTFLWVLLDYKVWHFPFFVL